jgi:hypothetical protein
LGRGAPSEQRKQAEADGGSRPEPKKERARRRERRQATAVEGRVGAKDHEEGCAEKPKTREEKPPVAVSNELVENDGQPHEEERELERQTYSHDQPYRGRAAAAGAIES